MRAAAAWARKHNAEDAARARAPSARTSASPPPKHPRLFPAAGLFLPLFVLILRLLAEEEEEEAAAAAEVEEVAVAQGGPRAANAELLPPPSTPLLTPAMLPLTPVMLPLTPAMLLLTRAVLLIAACDEDYCDDDDDDVFPRCLRCLSPCRRWWW